MKIVLTIIIQKALWTPVYEKTSSTVRGLFATMPSEMSIEGRLDKTLQLPLNCVNKNTADIYGILDLSSHGGIDDGYQEIQRHDARTGHR